MGPWEVVVFEPFDFVVVGNLHHYIEVDDDVC